jgi:hypothetical protein
MEGKVPAKIILTKRPAPLNPLKKETDLMKLMAQILPGLALLGSLPLHAGENSVVNGVSSAAKVIAGGQVPGHLNPAAIVTSIPEPSQWGCYIFAVVLGFLVVRKLRSKLTARS